MRITRKVNIKNTTCQNNSQTVETKDKKILTANGEKSIIHIGAQMRIRAMMLNNINHGREVQIKITMRYISIKTAECLNTINTKCW